jgi:hypothetical protein
MSKKAVARPKPALDRLADWLARQSRLVRSIIAGLIALVVTGAGALLLYGFLISLPSGSLNIGSLKPGDILLIGLIALTVIGFILYWVGWRVLIGFDFSEHPLQPGRPAAVWVMFGLIALIATLILVTVYAITAVAPG